MAIKLTVQGRAPLVLNRVLMDFNGTLAKDGQLVTGVASRLHALSRELSLHVLTGDLHGSARQALSAISCTVDIVSPENQAIAKAQVLDQFGTAGSVVIGNGLNDVMILRNATLSIAVDNGEGLAVEAMMAADIVCHGIVPTLDLLLNPSRLVGTLRR